MKRCPSCSTQYADDANFCPQEACASEAGPRRLDVVPDEPPARYQLGASLGGGASGQVFAAVDTQTGSNVAYKLVVAEALPSPAVFDRALRELRQLAKVTSASAARTLDHGKTADGRLFVVAELCDGEPLDRMIATSGPLELEAAKSLVAQIGDALLEAQKVGVVHRDLAAKNVLVSAQRHAKLINFAIARPLSDRIFGVPEFISPEQAEGKSPDQRSNTYSLAALLYLMVTGEVPFSGADPKAVAEMHLRSEPEPPSRRRQDGDVSPEVDRVILKALDKSASRRHLTLRQFLADVAALRPISRQVAAASPAAMAAAFGAGDKAAFNKTIVFAGGGREIALPAGVAAPVVEAAGNLTPQPATATAGHDTLLASETPAPSVAAVVGGRNIAVGVPITTRPGWATGAEAESPAAPFLPATPPPESVPAVASESTKPETSADDHANPLEGAVAPPETKAFRETLWFKKGEVEQMVARGRDAGAPQATAPEDVRPIEDRYVDDGSVSSDDRRQFSVDSGAPPSVSAAMAAVPGERMSDEEMLREMGGGRRNRILFGAGAMVLVLVLVLAFALSGGDKSKRSVDPGPPASPTPASSPPPAPSPAPTPVARVEPLPAPSAKPTPTKKSHRRSRAAKSKGSRSAAKDKTVGTAAAGKSAPKAPSKAPSPRR